MQLSNNPVPIDIKPRVLSTAIDLDDATASLDLAIDVASYFEISDKDSRQIAFEVGTAVAAWRNVGENFDLTAKQINRMASAFEHSDVQKSMAGKPLTTAKKARKSKQK
ncbi:hypothetical protein BH11CYA1_BH11CYA1_49370 [soil metagenome]